MHRIRRANRIGLAAAAGLALVGAGSAIALSANASGSTPAAAPQVEVDSVGCSGMSAPGGRPHGYCIFTLTDGRRYRCPLRFGNHLQTPRSLERAKRCHAVAPIRINAAWKPVLAHLSAVESCLTGTGLAARGGPIFENPDPKRVPVGELVVFEHRPITLPPAYIAFYLTAKAAARAEPRLLRILHPDGGGLKRQGSVTAFWTKPPPAQMNAAINACAFS